jgi:hypothetical protein
MSRASPLAMKLPELKKRVWQTWVILNSWKGELTSPPESYVSEIKSLGDRRFIATWIKALARLEAMFTYESCLDGWALIAISFNFTPSHSNYEYRHEILDEFLMYPDGLEMIRAGLEQLFSSDFSPQEREDANGFFKLLEERDGVPERISFAIGSERALAEASAAA